MKKKYVKPELYYERFILSHNIADCGWNMNMTMEGSCTAVGDATFDNPEITILLDWCENEGGFNVTAGDFDICYQSGTNTDDTRIFLS